LKGVFRIKRRRKALSGRRDRTCDRGHADEAGADPCNSVLGRWFRAVGNFLGFWREFPHRSAIFSHLRSKTGLIAFSRRRRRVSSITAIDVREGRDIRRVFRARTGGRTHEAGEKLRRAGLVTKQKENGSQDENRGSGWGNEKEHENCAWEVSPRLHR